MKRDVAGYYNQTQNHYERWWNLRNSMSLHYGIWFENTSSLSEALKNTNSTLSDLVNIKPGDVVLDAGCGVGGSCIYLAQKGAIVHGVTLSGKQVETARNNAKKHGLDSRVHFLQMDFTETTFPAHYFDIIWACESLSSVSDKLLFLKEASRLLKPQGRIVIADFYRSDSHESPLLSKWSESWAMAELVTFASLKKTFESNGYIISKEQDFTSEIQKTSKRMYRASLVGQWPSRLYNLLFQSAYYARNHYKSGLIQYQALKQKLWKYHVMLAEKK